MFASALVTSGFLIRLSIRGRRLTLWLNSHRHGACGKTAARAGGNPYLGVVATLSGAVNPRAVFRHSV